MTLHLVVFKVSFCFSKTELAISHWLDILKCTIRAGFPVVVGRDGDVITVPSKPKPKIFPASIGYHIFLSMGTRARAPLLTDSTEILFFFF